MALNKVKHSCTANIYVGRQVIGKKWGILYLIVVLWFNCPYQVISICIDSYRDFCCSYNNNITMI